MKSIIKCELKAYLCDKKKVLLLLIFAFFCGTQLNIAVETGMGVYEYVLFIMSNHYYIIYFLLMSYIYFQCHLDSVFYDENSISYSVMH